MLMLALSALCSFMCTSYCYAGVGAQAASLLLAEVSNRSATDSEWSALHCTCGRFITCVGLFTIGAAYAAGIAFAITTGGPLSSLVLTPEQYSKFDRQA